MSVWGVFRPFSSVFFFKVSLGRFQAQAGAAFAIPESPVGHRKKPQPAQDPQGYGPTAKVNSRCRTEGVVPRTEESPGPGWNITKREGQRPQGFSTGGGTRGAGEAACWPVCSHAANHLSLVGRPPLLPHCPGRDQPQAPP